MQNKLMKIEDVEQTIQTEKWRDRLELYKKGPELDIFYADVMTAFTMGQNSEQLRNCMTTNTGRASVFYTLTYAAQSGLSINPNAREARLATYWDKTINSYKCSFEVDKDGLIKNAQNNGLTVTAEVKRENDELEYWRSSDGDHYKFKPALSNRGQVEGVWCALTEKTGRCHVRYMTMEEVTEHMEKYARRDKAGKINSIWNKSFVEMALKTVIKATIRNVRVGLALPEMTSPAEIESEVELPMLEAPEELPLLEGEVVPDVAEIPTDELMDELKRRSNEEAKSDEGEKQGSRF